MRLAAQTSWTFFAIISTFDCRFSDNVTFERSSGWGTYPPLPTFRASLFSLMDLCPHELSILLSLSVKYPLAGCPVLLFIVSVFFRFYSDFQCCCNLNTHKQRKCGVPVSLFNWGLWQSLNKDKRYGTPHLYEMTRGRCKRYAVPRVSSTRDESVALSLYSF